MTDPLHTARPNTVEPDPPHRIRRILIETDDGHVMDVAPHAEDQAVVSIDTLYVGRDGREGDELWPILPRPTNRARLTSITTFVKIDSRKRPADQAAVYTVHDQASAVVMTQTGPCEYTLDTPVTHRDVQERTGPDDVQIGVPDRAQPALVFVQRRPGDAAPGVWFLGRDVVPDTRMDRNLLRALLTTALADLDDAEKPPLVLHTAENVAL